MKKMMRLGLFGVWLMPTVVTAQSPFDGSWRVVPGSEQFPTKPDVYLLLGGTYHCPTCDPALKIQADGEDHAVAAPCYDSVSVKIVDDRTIQETDKRNGKTVGTSRMEVSSDGTATLEWTESCNTKGDVITGKKLLVRIAKGPRGSHAISGSWRTTKNLSMSENALVVTMKLEADMFSFSDPTGQSYTAKLDGTDTPIKGDLSATVVSVRRIGKSAIEQTNKINGNVVEIIRITVSNNGKTMTWSGGDKAKGTAWQFIAEKQ